MSSDVPRRRKKGKTKTNARRPRQGRRFLCLSLLPEALEEKGGL